jgi:hypothetical protein
MFRQIAALFLNLVLLCSCGGTGSTSQNSGNGGNNPPPSGGGNSGGSGGTGSTSTSCNALATGVGASLGGFVPFPASNAWNQDISTDAVDPNSSAIIIAIGSSTSVHADFGSGLYNGGKIGIPYVIVDGTQSLVPITFSAYGSESDPGPVPVPSSGPIEGDPQPGNGDRHVLVLNKGNCFLYELYGAYPGTNGSWSAASAAVWDMTATSRRPYEWTSADAAGLPIFPGLARYDEVASGKIAHALRFTLQQTRGAFVAPASHIASSSTSSNLAPMGMRMRLKASFDISAYSAANQVILKALKQYGMIMADNGSSMYISGAPDDRWDNNDLHQLGNLKASDFEVVSMGTVYTSANVPSGPSPTISSFSAQPTTTSASGSVTLNWAASNASYYVISPAVGAVRGNSVTVNPTATTTYTLYATNQYGRTTASVTVTVQ